MTAPPVAAQVIRRAANGLLARSIKRRHLLRSAAISHSLSIPSSQPFSQFQRAPYQVFQHQRRPSQRATTRASQRQTRCCSYRAKMYDTREIPSSSVDITKGRQVLPTHVRPVHYDVTLEPDFDKFTYRGTVIIDLDVKESTKSISLNTLEIDIHSTRISQGPTSISSDPHTKYDEDSQTTTFSFDKELEVGSKVKLVIDFTGQLNEKMAGFYRSSYKDEHGNTKYMATSQMEPTDARRAFPCFDEPALKSTFSVTLIADEQMTCLSNMDVLKEAQITSRVTGKPRKAVTFNKSPPMSTYLLAVIVGELNYIETKAFRVPVRVYAPTHQNIEHGKFSLDLAAKTLEFYEKTFDSSFPLPKMDMVAIPDFAAGAMENWGLVTYRIVDLMFDEKTSGAGTKERVAEVVQHELAHQWFGNLVTMDFWDGLWLNEGFATWMSWYSCNKFYPEWKVWQGYVTDNLQSALSLDSLRSSHPIEVPVKRADEINQIFDAISYSKGSCVLRQISKWIGEDTFMEGIRRYLKKHAYGNTQTGDLWAALSDASGKDVEKVMDIWTKQVGYPVVTVKEDTSSESITVSQNRFLRTADVKPDEDKTLYPVFLGLRTNKGIDEDATLYTREKEIKLDNLDFFKVNADHSGIYRTSYSPERLQKLGEAAKAGKLSVEDRAGMIADAGALSAAGYSKTSGVLNLLKGFDNEGDKVVWEGIISRIGGIRAAWMFEDEQVKDTLKAFQLQLTAKKAHELGWEFRDSDDHLLQQTKALLFGAAGSAGDEQIVKAAQEMFTKFKAGDTSAIHPNIRSSVYGIVLKNGGEEEYEAVLNAYRTSKNSDSRNSALRSLGGAKSPALIAKTLSLALSSEVKDQDIYLPIGGLRSHPEGINALWQWMRDNWKELQIKLPAGLSMLGSVVQICTGGFTTTEKAKEVEAWFDRVSKKGFERGLAQALDGIRAKDGWLKRDRGDVAEWAAKNGRGNLKQ